MTHKHYPGKIASDWFGLSVPLGRLSKMVAGVGVEPTT